MGEGYSETVPSPAAYSEDSRRRRRRTLPAARWASAGPLGDHCRRHPWRPVKSANPTSSTPSALTSALRKEIRPLGLTAMAVEPGAFRTDFAGRSLTQSAEALAAYAETAGKRRKENDTVHGTQPGDPARAAAALVEVVSSGKIPELLVLGSDALDRFRSVLDGQRAEIDAWEHVSTSTDFERT